MGGNQWWPQTRRPAGSGLWPERPVADVGDSGSITTAASSAITMQRLCSKTFAKPTDVILQVTSNIGGLGSSAISQSWDMCAVNPLGTGQLIVDYGSGSASERCKLDLRAGSYQLPTCEQVTVSVTTVVGSRALPAFSIGGALIAGRYPNPTIPTYTWVSALNLDDQVYVPARARFVDLWLANGTTTNVYGTGAPVLSLLTDGAQAQLIRDYNLGVWAPPFPVPLITAGALDGSFDREMYVKTTVACTAVVQFELAL